MIITISGNAGSGKSTVAKILAEKLKLKHYSSGDFMRKIAQDHDMSLHELSKVAEKEDWVDKELDKRQVDISKKEDNLVIDGRLSWHFIPNSIKVYLDVSDEKGAERIWKDKEQRGEEGFFGINDLVEKVRQRKKSEIKRYMQYYGINHHDKSQYDLVIDSSDITAEQTAQKIIDFIEKNR